MKKVYRIISTILVAAMITSSLSVMAAPNEVTQTEEDLETSVQTLAEPTPDEPNQGDTMPDIVDGIIQIDDEQELNNIGNDANYPLDGNYILTADITMTENFHPIGKEEEPFTGTFDGNGHVIYDLTIEEEGDNIGLFGVASEGAIIKNVGVENGSVTSEGLKVGGLVGWAAEATIENCYFVGDVSGDVAVGGLVGGSGQQGAFNTASTVKNCYQIGDVKGNNVVGGIEGVVASPGFSFSKMENCYHVGEIICSDVWCGGLIGYFYELGDISYSFENSYYDIGQCGSTVKNAIGYTNIQISNSNIKDLTTEQMTGSDAFNNMIGLEKDYTAPSQQKIYKDTEYYYYYYPQLNIFINDASDMNFYPRIEIYEPKDNTPAEPVEDNDPSTISTAEELQKIGNDKNYPLDGNYKLTNDIDMSRVEEFEPIGTKSDPFTGTFDGDGHVIYDLTIEEKGDNVGLFGVVSEGGIIKNVGIENGSVTSEGSNVGGLVGWAAEATIENCYFVGNLSGKDNVGGVVGFVGHMKDDANKATVKNCYQIGTVKGGNGVGGIIGLALDATDISSKMESCYHVGEIICLEDFCGALVGYDVFFSYENSYYDNQQCGSTIKDAIGFSYADSQINIKGLTTEQMTGSNALINMIGMEEAYTAAPEQKVDKGMGYYSYYYPQLNIFINDASDINEYPSIKTEDNNPSTISTAEELQKIGNDKSYPLNENYRLTNDIDMSGVEKFEPIGGKGTSKDFDGVFDGGGHVIYNLNVDTAKDDYAGLFGCVGSGGTVKNLGVEGTVKGDNYVGGLVGWLSDYATLENCYFIGDVTGDENVGGLVGQSGDQGIWSGGSSDIINCYNIGKIEGNKYVGGIVGLLLITRDAPKVENCYHTGTVNCLELKCKAVGGLVGYFTVAHYFGAPDEENILKNSYYDKDTSNIKNAIGEVDYKSSITEGDHDEWNFKGLTTGEMTGSDALNYMTNLKDDYIVAPNDDGYPQLNIFVTDANDPSQFPTIAMA